MIRPISRRRALQLGGLGLAGTIIGGVGLASELTSGFDPVGSAPLREPPVLRSVGGVLDVRIEAAEGRVHLAGREATTLAYNGGVPGPTLYLRPGDRLRVDLFNRLATPTNLHTHGLHVSPRGNGDNPFVVVEPGTSFRYDHQLPADHPPGTYWYHPHHHGLVADQIFGGLYGAIIVDDPAPVPDISDRMLIISDISLDGAGRIRPVSTMARMMGREGDLILVNGQARPRLTARPGERQRWRILNACTARYLRLRLDGQQLQLLGLDSGRYPRPRTVQEVILAPGNRADLLVTARPGTGHLRALPYDRGSMTGMGTADRPMGSTATGATVLATLDVTGNTVTTPADLPARPAPRDLRGAAVTARRELTLAMGSGMGMAGMRVTIDGRTFDPDRVDQTVAIATIEEWTLTNTSPMDHPLHLHVWPMQIVEDDGHPVDPPSWQDVVNVPAHGRTKVLIAFNDYTGRTVYHCHILDHEDHGMMGVINAT